MTGEQERGRVDRPVLDYGRVVENGICIFANGTLYQIEPIDHNSIRVMEIEH